jgi:hypothetical protein
MVQLSVFETGALLKSFAERGRRRYYTIVAAFATVAYSAKYKYG